jgi:hypothetical protein
LEYFKNKYPQALFYPPEAYYLIADKDSKTTKDEFKYFCEKVGIPYEEKLPQEGYLFKDSVRGGFSVPEPVFNTRLLVTLLEQEALGKEVKIVKGSEVTGSNVLSDGMYRIIAREDGRSADYHADIIINSTYAYANNILKLLGLEEDITRYKLQTTEVVVVKSPKLLPALTVMDGKFISVMPYADFVHQNIFLIYDVMYSIAHEEEGYFYDASKTYPSNWKKMIDHGSQYFPFMHELEYLSSLWGSRPIPIDSKGDSRQTRLISHKSALGIYSILEGKFISAPIIAQKLAHLVRETYLNK